MTVRVVTAPTVEPVALNEMRLHLRLGDSQTEQDALIATLIKTATAYAENYTRRALVEQTLELTLECFPGGEGIIEIPRPPLQSITHVKWIDENGTLQTKSAAEYQVDTYREPGLVKPAYGETWEFTRSDFNAVQIRYVAGYASVGSPLDARSGVPQAAKDFIKLYAAQLFENREATAIGNIVTPQPHPFVHGLLDPYVVSRF